MAPSVCIELSRQAQTALLQLARRVIEHGVHHGTVLDTSDADPSPGPGAMHGVFVTLRREGKLRGCIGSLEARSPLPRAVADAAYSAAFQDPRFAPLRREELDEVSLEISLLSTQEPIAVGSRDELLDALAPGLDGLVIEDGRHRATFLPKVWEQLPEPAAFLDHLLDKAGLPRDHWSPGLRCSRYRSLTFEEPLARTLAQL